MPHTQAIRDAYAAVPHPTMGRWHGITATVDDATAHMLVRQNVIANGNHLSSLDLAMIKPGRLLNDLPVEPLLYHFKLDGTNQIRRTGLPVPASESDILHWLSEGMPATPLMRLDVSNAAVISRVMADNANAAPSLEAMKMAKESPYTLVLETINRPSGKQAHTLLVGNSDGTTLEVDLGSDLPVPERLPSIVAEAVARRPALEATSSMEPPAVAESVLAHKPAEQAGLLDDFEPQEHNVARHAGRMTMR